MQLQSYVTFVQGFCKIMVGLKGSIEEYLVRKKEQNMCYFTRITEGLNMDCMTTIHIVLFLCL